MKYLCVKKKNAHPIFLHIPHNSTMVPYEFFSDFTISKKEAQQEAIKLSDWKVFDLFKEAWTIFGGLKSNVSRLVVDMERFSDDRKEPMSKVGMGVFYEKNSQRNVIRKMSKTNREKYLKKLYFPYHKALDELAEHHLNKFGTGVILDCHTFPNEVRAYDQDAMRKRPDVCIGTDSYHTPRALASNLLKNFSENGFKTSLNRPYKGAMVPMKYYHKDKKVISVMIEVNRSVYMDEEKFVLKADFDDTAKRLNKIIISILSGFVKK